MGRRGVAGRRGLHAEADRGRAVPVADEGPIGRTPLEGFGGYFGTKKANAPLHVVYGYDDRSVAVVSSSSSTKWRTPAG